MYKPHCVLVLFPASLLYFATTIGFEDRDVPENVVVYGEQGTERVRIHFRCGNPASAGRKLRLPDGVNHDRVPGPEKL